MKREDTQMEVDRNFKAFQEQLPDLVLREGGRFALLKSGECVEFFDTARDAQTAVRIHGWEREWPTAPCFFHRGLLLSVVPNRESNI